MLQLVIYFLGTISPRKNWTSEQKKIVYTAFKAYINSESCPPANEIDDLKSKNRCLDNKDRGKVKSWFNNQQKKFRRNALDVSQFE